MHAAASSLPHSEPPSARQQPCRWAMPFPPGTDFGSEPLATLTRARSGTPAPERPADHSGQGIRNQGQTQLPLQLPPSPPARMSRARESTQAPRAGSSKVLPVSPDEAMEPRLIGGDCPPARHQDAPFASLPQVHAAITATAGESDDEVKTGVTVKTLARARSRRRYSTGTSRKVHDLKWGRRGLRAPGIAPLQPRLDPERYR